MWMLSPNFRWAYAVKEFFDDDFDIDAGTFDPNRVWRVGR